MNITIRDATADDFSQLFDISVKVHQRDYGSYIPESEQARFHDRYDINDKNRQVFLKTWLARFHSDTWHFWVAVDEEKRILGFTQALVLGKHHGVKRGMFVLSEFQGNGIGSRLMAASLKCIEHGNIDLFVLKENTRAQALYKKYGFAISGDVERTFYGAQLIRMTTTV